MSHGILGREPQLVACLRVDALSRVTGELPRSAGRRVAICLADERPT
jgi:hypothetical protein